MWTKDTADFSKIGRGRTESFPDNAEKSPRRLLLNLHTCQYLTRRVATKLTFATSTSQLPEPAFLTRPRGSRFSAKMIGHVTLFLLAVFSGMVSSFPVQDSQIFFPGDAEIQANEARPSAFNVPETAPRSYYTSEHYTSGGDHHPKHWPSSASGSLPHGSGYGTSNHRVSYSSYGSHPGGHRLSYSSHSGSYGSGGGGQHTYSQQQYPSSYGSTHKHFVVSETSDGHSGHPSHHGADWASHSERENGGGTGYSVSRQETITQHRPETIVEEQQGGDQVWQASSAGHGQRPVDTAAAEHHIIEEMKQLVGVTSSPHASTKDPIAQQQEIIREIKDLAQPSPKPVSSGAREESRQDSHDNLSHVNNGAAISSLGSSLDSTNTEVKEGAFQVQPAQTSHEHNREEIVESPLLKETSHYRTLGGSRHTIHTQTREESSHVPHNARSTPDPLDLASLLDAYNNGDFKPGSGRTSTPQPQKELDPEIKQAINNIMKEWEIMPDREGKPVPPQRNYKVTKHVKVTKTTHNAPVVHTVPGHTITKVTRTETVHPSSGAQRKVIRHHVNIGELLEQLRQIESSNPHRNITWCEEKIKEFLTELNRKEESGIEINQSVQEETLHHILTQDQTVTHDHTITKEVHHEVGHDADGGVVEEPYVKKTVVELGLNEPTKPPSYWTEEQTLHETHTATGGDTEHGQTVGNGEVVNEIIEETKDIEQPGEINYGHEHETERPYISPEVPEIVEEQQIFTDAPNQEHVPPLESLSHQTHGHSSSETIVPEEKEEVVEEAKEVENPPNQTDEEVNVSVPPQIPAIQEQKEIDEFKGETQVQHRPLPPNYKPHESEEEEEIHHEHTENEVIREEPKETSQVIHNEGKQEEHKSIEDLSIDLPFFNETAAQEEVKTEQEQQAGGRDTSAESTVIQSHEGHQNTGGHYAGGYEVVNQEEGAGGSSHHETQETVEHVIHELGGHGHSGGSTNTEYTEETVEHNSGGSHVNTEINYDQLIEELISLESLPGHQAIDKCDEKIRQFLEVLKRQQERGFDDNKLELERLRRLIEEMQAQRRNQQEQGSIPQSTEAPSSFWKKVGKKIKATIQKAKSKASDILNTEEH